MRKLIFILILLLPFLGMGQIIYDNVESESLDAGWSFQTYNGGTAADASTDAAIDSCWGMVVDVATAISQESRSYVVETFTAESEIFIRTYWNLSSATGTPTGGHMMFIGIDGVSFGTSIRLTESAGTYYLQGYESYVSSYGSSQAISLDTKYELKIRLKNDVGGDTVQWWLDGALIATATPGYADVDMVGFGFRVFGDDYDLTAHYDNMGVYTSDPGNMGTPDACPGEGKNNKINGVLQSDAIKIGGISVSNIGKVNGVDWQ